MPTLAELYVYPVKSCRGIPVDSAVVTPTGEQAAMPAAARRRSLPRLHAATPTTKSPCLCFAGLAFDRNWVIVRAESGKFLTQRQLPKWVLPWASCFWQGMRLPNPRCLELLLANLGALEE